MASSATFNTSNTNVKYRIDFDLLSQDVTNNTSLVRVRVFFWRTNTGYETYGSGSCTLTYNYGASSWSQTVTPSQKITSTGIYLFSLDMQFSHESDGTRTVNLGAYINLPGILTSSEQRADFDLPQIQRAATLTSTDSGATFGSTIEARWSGVSPYTYQVKFTSGAYSKTVTTAEGASSWDYTPPLSWLAAFPNTTTTSVKVELKTFYNGSQIGSTSSKTIYQSVPTSIVPTIDTPTLSHVDIFPADPVPTGWGYVQTRSGITVSASSAGVYDSTITSMSIGGGGYTNAAVSVSSGAGSRTFGVLNISGTNKFTVTVTDSRGRTASVIEEITVNAYSRPKISNVLTQRATSGGVQDSGGTYALGKATYAFSAVGSNAVVRNVNYRESGGEWVDAEVSFNSGVAFLIGGGFDVLKSYEITYIVDDQFNTVIYTDILSVATPILHFKKGGLMAAIGKRVSDFIGLDIGFPTKFREPVTIDNDLSVTSISIGGGALITALKTYTISLNSVTVPANSAITLTNPWSGHHPAGWFIYNNGSNSNPCYVCGSSSASIFVRNPTGSTFTFAASNAYVRLIYVE